MANPNINSPSSAVANNAILQLSATTETQLVSNAASSSKVFLIDSIVVANVSAASADITVTLYPNATNTGTPAKIASAITVAPKSTLTVATKNMGVSVKENQSVYCTGSVSAALHVVAFWKEFA